MVPCSRFIMDQNFQWWQEGSTYNQKQPPEKFCTKAVVVNFAKFLRKPFFKEHVRRLLLLQSSYIQMKLRICNTRIHFVRTKVTSNLTQRSLKTTEAWNFGQSWNISKQKKTYLSIVIVDYNFCCLRTLDYLHMINILLSYIQVD